MVASFPGVMFGRLYRYRQLEIEKVAALKQNNGNFEVNMQLSDIARSDLHWWIENVTNLSNTVIHGTLFRCISDWLGGSSRICINCRTVVRGGIKKPH